MGAWRRCRKAPVARRPACRPLPFVPPPPLVKWLLHVAWNAPGQAGAAPPTPAMLPQLARGRHVPQAAAALATGPPCRQVGARRSSRAAAAEVFNNPSPVPAPPWGGAGIMRGLQFRLVRFRGRLNMPYNNGTLGAAHRHCRRQRAQGRVPATKPLSPHAGSCVCCQHNLSRLHSIYCSVKCLGMKSTQCINQTQSPAAFQPHFHAVPPASQLHPLPWGWLGGALKAPGCAGSR